MPVSRRNVESVNSVLGSKAFERSRGIPATLLVTNSGQEDDSAHLIPFSGISIRGRTMLNDF